MAADLYLFSLYDRDHQRWQSDFDSAVAARDRAGDRDSQQAAQLRVDHFYDLMNGRGYFRDGYSHWNVLNKFELSWPEDVLPLLNDSAQLTPARAASLLQRIEAREALFNQSIADMQQEDQSYFQRKYQQLHTFLTQSIQRNEPIVCSL